MSIRGLAIEGKINVDSKRGHKQVNLLQYRRLDGRWQFVPEVRKNGKPDPELILVHGEPTSSKGGHFYTAWREEGKLKRKAVGSSPREALTSPRPETATVNSMASFTG